MSATARFTESDMKAFEPSEKVGIIATVTPEGQPHLSLLTSVMAAAPDQLMIGEFCKGQSKAYMQQTRKVGFAVLTLDKKLWQGKALWTHCLKEGPEYELYNQQPMFRYNTYFGINTVHYLDVLETTHGAALPLGSIVFSSLATKIAKSGAAADRSVTVLTHFGQKLFNALDALKFLAFIDKDGYPVVVPLIQCQAADSGRLAFHPGAAADALAGLKPGSTVAVFALTMQMENVLTRGIFTGCKRFWGISLGTIDLNWVYNSMPPNHGQIYPPVPLEPVVHF